MLSIFYIASEITRKSSLQKKSFSKITELIVENRTMWKILNYKILKQRISKSKIQLKLEKMTNKMRSKQPSKLGMKILTPRLRNYSMGNKKQRVMRVKMLMLKLKKQRMKKKNRRKKENKRNLPTASNVFGVFGHQRPMMKRKKNQSCFLMLLRRNVDWGVIMKRIMNQT